MIVKRILVTIIVLFSLLPAEFYGQSQPLSTGNKRAEKFFYSAYDFYQAKNFERALNEVKKAIDQDPGFTEAFILQGDIFADDQQKEKAIDSYHSAFQTGNPVFPGLYYIIAGAELSIGRYADARLNFKRFLESDQMPEQKRRNAERGLKISEFGEKCVANPVPFLPFNLGDSVNTEFDEYINGVTADEERLYFTRWDLIGSGSSNQNRNFNEEFYQCLKKDSLWLKALNLGSPINSEGNEGALSISPDGNYLFFAACNREDGFGSCDIYRSMRNGNGWSEPVNLGETVNSPQWDSQPSFSSDGKTLYFASKRPGGKGSSDIWKTVLQPNGGWSVPVNLGDSVNTPAEEMAPFIHPDDQTLYFSSKGHLGLGGYDLFVTRKKPDGKWQKPVNLGYPINTYADEITLVVNAKGNLAYISSDKLGGKGRQDIYQFQLYHDARPLLTNYFKGIVFDETTEARLEARFELIDLTTSKIVAESRSDRLTGEFLLALPTERNYALNVSLNGYLFYSDNFMMSGTNTQAKPFIKDIPLKPIMVGEAVVLKNIFFDTDKFILKDESLAELNKLLGLLIQNPNLKIEISGHTDNVGSAEHNLELSRNRAKAVYEFLIENKVGNSRLSFAGYGFQKPIDENMTEAGRANNRRTEFKVIGN
ncbi:MAG: OmpA family protein [Bacteroidetes bacterium]|nr:OmpA family protein [Bacteroidota bacterium]